MEAALQIRERTAEAALPDALADRLARIAWLAARSHGVGLDDVVEGSRFNPAATQARAVAMVLCSDLLKAEPRFVARYFDCAERAVEAATRASVERVACDPEFRTTMNFLKSSCAAVLGTT